MAGSRKALWLLVLAILPTGLSWECSPTGGTEEVLRSGEAGLLIDGRIREEVYGRMRYLRTLTPGKSWRYRLEMIDSATREGITVMLPERISEKEWRVRPCAGGADAPHEACARYFPFGGGAERVADSGWVRMAMVDGHLKGAFNLYFRSRVGDNMSLDADFILSR